MRAIQYLISLIFFIFASKVQGLVILQYHHVAENTPAATTITPKLFQQHLDYLEANQFKVLDLRDILPLLRNREPLPDKAVVITFDDGYNTIADNALPRLKEKGWPFTVFINAQPIEQKLAQFMSFEILQAMQQEGALMLNHSYSHAHLIRLKPNESDAQWLARMENEVERNQTLIEKFLGETPKVFAYPYGEYNHKLQAKLDSLGYIAFGQQSGAVSPNGDLLAIPRFPFGGAYGKMEDFKTKVNSLPLPVESVVLKTQDGKVLKDHVLSPSESKPTLHITLRDDSLDVTCFYARQGALNKTVDKKMQSFSLDIALLPGRSRFNCTAPAGSGRFYWYSQPFIKPKDDGSWYTE